MILVKNGVNRFRERRPFVDALKWFDRTDVNLVGPPIFPLDGFSNPHVDCLRADEGNFIDELKLAVCLQSTR